METRDGTAAVGVAETRALVMECPKVGGGGLEARICPNNIRRIRSPSSHVLGHVRSIVTSAVCFVRKTMIPALYLQCDFWRIVRTVEELKASRFERVYPFFFLFFFFSLLTSSLSVGPARFGSIHRAMAVLSLV